MSTLVHDREACRCPDCGALRDSPSASCDLCAYDPDRFVSEADTTWSDRSPATQLHEVPPAPPPCPPADLLTVETPGAARWWGWLLMAGVALSWLARGCR